MYTPFIHPAPALCQGLLPGPISPGPIISLHHGRVFVNPQFDIFFRRAVFGLFGLYDTGTLYVPGFFAVSGLARSRRQPRFFCALYPFPYFYYTINFLFCPIAYNQPIFVILTIFQPFVLPLFVTLSVLQVSPFNPAFAYKAVYSYLIFIPGTRPHRLLIVNFL